MNDIKLKHFPFAFCMCVFCFLLITDFVSMMANPYPLWLFFLLYIQYQTITIIFICVVGKKLILSKIIIK